MLQIIRSQFLKSRQLLSEQKGFTMIELLVVMGVLMILFGLAYATGLFDSSEDSARRATTLQDLNQIRDAIIIYRNASLTGAFPNALGDLATGLNASQTKDGVARTNLVSPGRTSDSTTFKDQWNNQITYDKANRKLISTAGGGGAAAISVPF